MADEWAQYARQPAGGDEWSQYARQAPSNEPGSSPDNPLQEQGVTFPEREAMKWFAKDPQAQAQWLQKAPGEGGKPKGLPVALAGQLLGMPIIGGLAQLFGDSSTHQYDTKEYAPGRIAVRPKGSNEPWKVVNPDTGVISSDLPRDILDHLPDIALGLAPIGKAASLGGAVLKGAGQFGAQAGILEGGRRAIGKYAFGMEDTPGDIAKGAVEQGVTGAAVGGALPIAGAAVKGAAGWVGKQLQKPFRYGEELKPKLNKILEDISGKTAQNEAEAATSEAAKAKRAADAQQAISDMVEKQKQSEADRAAKMMERLGKKARSTEESAQFAEEGMNASEYGKEASRLKAQAKDLAKQMEGQPKESADLAQEEIDKLLTKADEMTTKARETRSRTGVGRVASRMRTAEEAARELEAAGGGRERPTFGGEAAPAMEEAAASTAKAAIPETAGVGRQAAEEEVHQLYQQLRETVHTYNQQAFALKNQYQRGAANKIFTWDEVEPIISEIMDSRHQFSQTMHEKVHRAAVNELTKIGMPQEAAVKVAAYADKIAEVKSAIGGPGVEPPKLSDIIERGTAAIGRPSAEQATEEAARRGTEAALGSVRAQFRVGPGIFRSTAADLSRASALIGHFMEHPEKLAEIRPTPSKNVILRTLRYVRQQATTPQARRALVYVMARDPDVQKAVISLGGN